MGGSVELPRRSPDRARTARPARAAPTRHRQPGGLRMAAQAARRDSRRSRPGVDLGRSRRG
eukprot:1043987-Alexandrium_andersonii.AAC.1